MKTSEIQSRDNNIPKNVPEPPTSHARPTKSQSGMRGGRPSLNVPPIAVDVSIGVNSSTKWRAEKLHHSGDGSPGVEVK